MSKISFQITQLCHRMAQPFIQKGDICIDATMGNGYDTQFLCESVGEDGSVIAFDIQPQALCSTKERLDKCGFTNYTLYQQSHEMLGEHVDEGSVSCVFFNLGYLPGADHALATKASSTIAALSQACRVLRKGGAVMLCIYSGGDSGYEEKDAVLSWLKSLNSKEYLVLVTEYWNRENDPPIPVLIIKNG